MATHTHSTPMPAPQRRALSLVADAALAGVSSSAGRLADDATAAVLSRLAIPFVFRPCAPSAYARTANELLDEIGREIARQSASPAHGGGHAAA